MRWRNTRGCFPTYMSTWCGASRAVRCGGVATPGESLPAIAEVQSNSPRALIYPAMVCCVGAGIVAFFMFFMMRGSCLSAGSASNCHCPTRLLMGFSIFSAILWLLGLLIIVAIILFKRFQASAEGAPDAG